MTHCERITQNVASPEAAFTKCAEITEAANEVIAITYDEWAERFDVTD